MNKIIDGIISVILIIGSILLILFAYVTFFTGGAFNSFFTYITGVEPLIVLGLTLLSLPIYIYRLDKVKQKEFSIALIVFNVILAIPFIDKLISILLDMSKEADKLTFLKISFSQDRFVFSLVIFLITTLITIGLIFYSKKRVMHKVN